MSTILNALFSQSFAEKVLLLVLTAVLTSILAPYINARLAHQKFKEQRLFEAEIARQSKIIDSQNELLIEIERLVHDFLLRALAVGWYKIYDTNPSKYQESRNAYEENSWEFFLNMQVAIGKANRLTSPDAHKKLEEFYGDMMELDANLVKLLKRDATDEEWMEFYNKIRSDYGSRLKLIMKLLAQDYGLSKE